MSIRPDDPRLTAYHLGELPSEEMAAVERAAAADPAVRLALRETGKLTGFLEDALGPDGRNHLRASQREAIRRAGRDADSEGKVVELASAGRSLRPWWTGLGAAAVVAFAAVLMSRLNDGPGEATGPSAREVALLSQPGPALGDPATGVASGGEGSTAGAGPSGASGSSDFLREVARELEQGALPGATELPATQDQASFSDVGELRLPVRVGTASATWVRRWIEEKGELPPKRAVRVEEMVNTVTLPTSEERDGLRIGLSRTEWNGSLWVGVQLAAGDQAVSDLSIVSESDQARRIVGSFARRDDDTLPSRLEAGRSTLVLIEFEREDVDPGELVVRRGQQEERFVLVEARRSGVPAMRQAVALATFGRWLRGEQESEDLLRAIEFAEQGSSDPVDGQTHRLMRRALDLVSTDR